MLRVVLGIIAGIFTGAIVIFLTESAGHLIFPPPSGVDFTDHEQARAAISRLHPGALVAVLVGWALGVFAGGWTAAFIARRGAWPAWAVAAVLLALAIWTMLMIPHPWWMWAGAILLTVSAGWLAGKLQNLQRGA